LATAVILTAAPPSPGDLNVCQGFLFQMACGRHSLRVIRCAVIYGHLPLASFGLRLSLIVIRCAVIWLRRYSLSLIE